MASVKTSDIARCFVYQLEILVLKLINLYLAALNYINLRFFSRIFQLKCNLTKDYQLVLLNIKTIVMVTLMLYSISFEV